MLEAWMTRAARLALAALFSSSVLLAQGASESLEREARAAFKAGRFKEAAIKFQDAADSATETPRRAKMQFQAAYALFNDKNSTAAKDAVRRALDADAELEVVAEFYSPDFLRLVDEVKRSARPTPPPAPVDIGELKRVASEKLKDGHADEVVYDLTHVPPERLDADAWRLLASAYEAMGRPVQAEAARRAASGGSTSISPAPAPVPALDAMVAEARSALASGDLATAQTAATKAAEAQPTSPEAQRLVGDVAAARGDRAAAESAWRKALTLDPKSPAADSLIALLLESKNVEPALSLVAADPSLAARARPRFASAGRGFAKEKDFTRAKQAYAAAVNGGNDAALLTEYGVVLLDAGDGDGAVDALRRAAAASPASATAHSNLAVALRRKGDAAEAEKEYRQALTVEPENAAALTGLGAVLLLQGKPADAVEPLRRASANNAGDATVLALLVRAQRESGDPTAALATAEAARGMEDPTLLLEAGAAAFAMARYGDAATYFERALAKDPANASAKENLEKARQMERFTSRLEKQAPVQGLVTTK